MSHPFSRFHAVLTAMAAAIGLGASRDEAFEDVGGYKSRGHGRGSYARSFRKLFRSRHRPNHYHSHAREIARRQRQLAAGTLRTNVHLYQ